MSVKNSIIKYAALVYLTLLAAITFGFDLLSYGAHLAASAIARHGLNVTDTVVHALGMCPVCNRVDAMYAAGASPDQIEAAIAPKTPASLTPSAPKREILVAQPTKYVS